MRNILDEPNVIDYTGSDLIAKPREIRFLYLDDADETSLTMNFYPLGFFDKTVSETSEFPKIYELVYQAQKYLKNFDFLPEHDDEDEEIDNLINRKIAGEA